LQSRQERIPWSQRLGHAVERREVLERQISRQLGSGCGMGWGGKGEEPGDGGGILIAVQITPRDPEEQDCPVAGGGCIKGKGWAAKVFCHFPVPGFQQGQGRRICGKIRFQGLQSMPSRSAPLEPDDGAATAVQFPQKSKGGTGPGDGRHDPGRKLKVAGESGG
jgi:hypothetical protein